MMFAEILIAFALALPVVERLACRWLRARKYRLRARREADARLMEGR